MEPTPRPRLREVLLAVLALAALAGGAIATVLPPAPAPASAPEQRFSAHRAFTHVQQVGGRVHVAGSGAAQAVRAYAQQYLDGLGLRTEVHEGVGATAAFRGGAMARVRNLVAVLPGTAPSAKRLFLVAHYDSVQVSYGANDDGAGVATLLETARALVSGPRLRNDVVFVLTDAEEACLCGAEAFVSQHGLAAQGGVVLNVEARGSGGPVVMFETSEGNAGVVGVYAAHAAHPVASSFAVEVYRILPNDTDFTPFLDSGRFTGLNAAYIDGSAVYHTPRDVPSTMDLGSLQQHGDNALALARAFGDADLAALAVRSSGDLTYFPVFGMLVRYPDVLVWPIAGLALACVVVLAVLARRRDLLTWPRLVGGVGLGLVPLLVAPAAAQGLWAALVAIRPGYGPMLDPWRPEWFRAGVVALTATVLLTWYGLLRRRVGSWPLVVGGLAWLAVLGLVLAALTPGGSYFAALPALAVAAALAVSLSITRPWVALAVVAAGAGVAVLVLAPLIVLFFPALGLATGAAAALLALLLGLAVLPVLAHLYPSPPPPSSTTDSALWTLTPARRRAGSAAPALVAGVLALGFVGAGLAVDHTGRGCQPAAPRCDDDRPTPTHLVYALDADTGQARWVSRSPGEWGRRYVTGPEDLSESFALLGDGLTTGPATAANLPPAEVEVVADTTSGGTRTLDLVVRPQRPVRLIHLRVSDVPVAGAVVDGREVPASWYEDGPLELAFHAPPPDGVPVRLTLSGTGPVTLRVLDGSDGLDGLPGFEPRPPGVGVAGTHDSELVVVGRTVRL